MNAHADITPETEEVAPFDPDGERTERHLRMLARMEEICMEVAETVALQAKAQKDLQSVADVAGVKEVIEETIVLEVRGDFGSVLAKIARALRLTIMLEDRLAAQLRRRQAGLEEACQARRQAAVKATLAEEADAADERVSRRQGAIDDAVRDVIRTERPEALDRERLYEALDGLWKYDIDTDPYHVQPNLYIRTGGDQALVSDQITAFCKALGLKPDWSLWKGSFWATEEAEEGAPGSPYAAKQTGPP